MKKLVAVVFVAVTLVVMVLFSRAQDFLIDEVFDIAEIKPECEWVKLKSGKEKGVLEPLMKFEIYRTSEESFKQINNNLNEHLDRNDPGYYLNIEFDDFLKENGLAILNVNRSMISSNHFDDHYRVYFLNDSKTIAIFWINSN